MIWLSTIAFTTVIGGCSIYLWQKVKAHQARIAEREQAFADSLRLTALAHAAQRAKTDPAAPTANSVHELGAPPLPPPAAQRVAPAAALASKPQPAAPTPPAPIAPVAPPIRPRKTLPPDPVREAAEREEAFQRDLAIARMGGKPKTAPAPVVAPTLEPEPEPDLALTAHLAAPQNPSARPALPIVKPPAGTPTELDPIDLALLQRSQQRAEQGEKKPGYLSRFMKR